MIVTSAQSNAQMLQDELICPVLLEPLSQAVSLVPCAHKIQQSTAEKIFGITNNGWQVQSRNPCPVCRTSILGYMIDHSTRNMVTFFELSEKEISKALHLVKENLAKKSISVEKNVIVNIPYPGKPARFIHKRGNWNVFDSGGKLCREMFFTSSTKGSLIEEFCIVGYKHGDVSIIMYFSEKSSNVKKYLKQFDLIPDHLDLANGYRSNNNNQLKAFFKIIADNNEIPASHFDKIRDIVAKKIGE